jgi:hypothetical protein
MPKVSELIQKLNHYALDDTIAWAIFDENDVHLIVQEENNNGSVTEDITKDEAIEILNAVYDNYNPEDGLSNQSIFNAYCDFLDRKGEPI